MNLLGGLLDLLFPPRCAGCGRRGIWLCDACSQSLPLIAEPVCATCGRPVAGVVRCSECWQHPPPFDGLRSAFYLEGTVREMIHQFKYKGARHLAPPLARISQLALSSLLRSPGTPQAVDFVVPVPLHPSRRAERGYNQSELIAVEMARALGTTVRSDAMSRVRNTPPQVGLSASDRQKNVRGAFSADAGLVRGKTVLLVDDVCTTAATIASASAALKTAGASRVLAFTVARARSSYLP